MAALKAAPVTAKFGGATGNYNAHRVAYPEYDVHLNAIAFLGNFAVLPKESPYAISSYKITRPSDGKSFVTIVFSNHSIVSKIVSFVTILYSTTENLKNPPPKDAVPTCKQAGVIGAMGGVIGSLQAMEAIKYLIGVGELLTGYLLTYDALTMEFHKIKLPKDTHNCAVCGDHPTILEPIDYEQEVCEETAGRFDAPRTQE